MTDSHTPDHLAAKHDRNREQRIAAIKRWVAYITSEPPEKWGPQQNAVVNDQLDAAQNAQTSAAHKQYVQEVAEAIAEAGDDTADTWPRDSDSASIKPQSTLFTGSNRTTVEMP